MRKSVKIIVVFVLTMAFLVSCSGKVDKALRYEPGDYLQYKGSVVGEGSDISDLVSMLMHGKYLDMIEVRPTEELYDIVVFYDFNGADEKRIVFEDLMTRNALIMFYLIDDVGTITFKDVDSFMDECTFDRETELTRPQTQTDLSNFDKNGNEYFEFFITDGSYKGRK